MLRAAFETSVVVGLLGPAVLLSGMARAEPMDLGDPRSRWVYVALENSPPNQPGRLDTIYTPKLPAWFEAADEPGQVRVSVARGLVERYLMAPYEPLPSSFSDFVWIFETRSGHVISARMSGRLKRSLDWGFFSSKVEAEIRVELDTRGQAGFERPKRLFGQLLYD